MFENFHKLFQILQIELNIQTQIKCEILWKDLIKAHDFTWLNFFDDFCRIYSHLELLKLIFFKLHPDMVQAKSRYIIIVSNKISGAYFELISISKPLKV